MKTRDLPNKTHGPNKVHGSAPVSLIAAALLSSGIASAQEAARSEPAGELEEIRVTGSRVARSANDAPTPVTTIGQEEIRAQAPGNIADFVNMLPSVRGSSTATNSAGALSNGAAGISALKR